MGAPRPQPATYTNTPGLRALLGKETFQPQLSLRMTQPQPTPWETLSWNHPGKPHPSSRLLETLRDSVCCWFKPLSSEWLVIQHRQQNTVPNPR